MIDTFSSTQKYVPGIFSAIDNVDWTCKKQTIPVTYIKKPTAIQQKEEAKWLLNKKM